MSKEFLEKFYFVSFNIIACIVFILFTLVVHGSVKTKDQNDYWIIHSYEVAHEARLVTIEVLQSELLLRNYFLTENNQIKSQVDALDKSISDHIARISKLVENSPEQLRRIEEIKKQYRIFIGTYDRLIALYDQNKISRQLIKNIQERHYAEGKLQKMLDEFYQAEQNLLDKRIKEDRQDSLKYRNTILFGAMLSVALLLVVNSLIYATIAKQRKKISTLLESADLLRALIDNMNDGIYDYNLMTGEAHYSQSYYRQLGYDQPLGSHNADHAFNDIIHPTDNEVRAKDLSDYITGKKETYQSTFRLKHKDGSWRWILSRGFIFVEAESLNKRLIGMQTDITEQKNQQLALQEINEELENFTYIASHDMRSPLVNLKGFVTETDAILQEVSAYLGEVEPPEEARKALKKKVDIEGQEASQFIHSAIERLQFQTDAILKLSRIGRHNYVQEKIDLNQLIVSVLSGLQFELKEKSIQLNIDTLPIIISDPMTTQQIIGNIIENAIKYLDPDRPGVLTVSGEKFIDETIIKIQDNGRGIDKKDEKKVFDIFRRARNSGNVRGSGMGLAYVRAAMRKLGGRIWFQSELNEGTIFYLAFPNKQDETHEPT